VTALAIPPKSDGDVLVVTAQGMGKRTALKDFPAKRRATSGVAAIALAKGDRIAGAALVTPDDDVVLGAAGGQALQVTVKDLRRQGRATKGSRLIEVDKNDHVATIARVG